jgi:YegS/Rv2252/BmrU family lipid kinase
MQKEGEQKILFVINPVSGGKAKQDWEVSIRDFFKDLPHAIEFYLLSGKNDAASIQHHVETIQPQKVVAVGGDGTVKMLAEIASKKSFVLGVLPAGSANGMARELNIPLVKEEALNVIVNGKEKQIDLIAINEKEICIHLSDMGLNAMLVKYFEENNKRGMGGYIKGVFKMLWNKQKIHATIVTDGGTEKRKAYMIVLANASKYGTGATINPDGELDDGRFEVVVVRRLNFWELLKLLITHKPFHEDKVEIFSTTKLELTTLKKSYFQVDGEYIGRVKSLRAQIMPKCLRLIVPDEVENPQKMA